MKGRYFKLGKYTEFLIEDGFLNIPTISLVFTFKYTFHVSLEFRKWISIGLAVDNFKSIKDNQISLIAPFSVFSLTWFKTTETK